MKYELPKPFSNQCGGLYTDNQMQAAHQAGRESMREDAAKVCEFWDASHPERIAKEIRSIKI